MKKLEFQQNFIMTNEHRILLERMMGWYWNIAKQQHLITPEDYNFLYELWNNGVSSYDEKMRERLNRIRNLYKETNTL
jgi:hemerythrin